jgi:hypothetical protein
MKWFDRHFFAFLAGYFVCFVLVCIAEATFARHCHHHGCACCIPKSAGPEVEDSPPKPTPTGLDIGEPVRVTSNPVALPVTSNPVAPPVATPSVAR